MTLRIATATLGVLALFAAGCRSEVPVRIRVLTYNIRHAEGTDGRLDLERIAEIIRRAAPDLAALQEVDRRTTRSHGVDQAEALGRLTGLEGRFGKAIDWGGGEYGNCVLSRLPIERHETRLLPSMDDGEQRAALVVEARVNGAPLVFISTHLDYREDPTERLAAVKVVDELAPTAETAILAGDLNCAPDSSALEALRASGWADAAEGMALKTFPAGAPERQIDYILYRPSERWRVVAARVLDEPLASDHRPVLVVLERVPGAAEPGS